MKKLLLASICGLTLSAVCVPLTSKAAVNTCTTDKTFIISNINSANCSDFQKTLDSLCNYSFSCPQTIPDCPQTAPEVTPEVPETPVVPETPETPEVPETPDSNTSTETPGSSDIAYANQVLTLVNEERAAAGVAPLTLDATMEQAAMVRASEIQTNFSHTRPNGSSFATALTEAGFSYQRSGENIAWGQQTPQEVVTAWMNSEGHRANILNSSFSKIGIGYRTNTSGTPYWVQLFAN